MTSKAALIGFGEAGQTFTAASQRRPIGAFDIKLDQPEQREAMLAAMEKYAVTACGSLQSALDASTAVLSLVTADRSLAAANAASDCIAPDALFLDMNSVSPQTKKSAALAIGNTGARYVDVAIMSPVQPSGLSTPLLVSGPDAEAGAEFLKDFGFADIRIAGAEVGQASATKMIRSVIIKGIEALTAECFLAAEAAGVTGLVLDSLGTDWADRANYNLDRMLVHGRRRAAEMEEVALTLKAMDMKPLMTGGTIELQRRLGALNLAPPPATLTEKLSAIASQREGPKT